MKDDGLKRQRRNSSNDDKILEDLLKEGNKINIDDLLKRIKTIVSIATSNLFLQDHLHGFVLVVTWPGIVEVEVPSAFVVVRATRLKELPFSMISHRA
ncbi:hypothetical protein Tco_1020726 [Tanacetum coccineum]